MPPDRTQEEERATDIVSIREAIRWSHPELHALHPAVIAAAADEVAGLLSGVLRPVDDAHHDR